MLTLDQVLADNRRMKKFICERLPSDIPTKIVLAHGSDGPLWVNLLATWDDDADCDLLIETNEPDAVSLRGVYDHFRHQELTGWEKDRELAAERNRRKVHESERAMGGEPKSIVLSAEKFLSAQDIVDYYQGKISLRLAYQIMDDCEPVRAGKKRLVTAESFEKYLYPDKAEEKAHKPDMQTIGVPDDQPIRTKRGNGQPDLEYEFFRFQR